MAIYEHGLLGPIRGKAGPSIGANWRSIHYLRSLPKKPNKPATEKQLAARLKFGMAADFLNPLRDIIRILPEGKATARKTNLNEATSIFLKNIKGVYPNFTIPFETVVFTKGSLMGVLPNIESIDNVGIKASWSTRLGQGASDDDEINIIVYDTGMESYYISDGILRSDGEHMISFNVLKAGTFHIWTFVNSSDGVERSNSRYCGVFDLG